MGDKILLQRRTEQRIQIPRPTVQTLTPNSNKSWAKFISPTSKQPVKWKRSPHHNLGTSEFLECLFSERPNNFCRDVQKENGTDEGKWKD